MHICIISVFLNHKKRFAYSCSVWTEANQSLEACSLSSLKSLCIDLCISRFPCCVLLALSWNTKKTIENPSTDKLRRAINYLCIDHNSNSQRTKKYIAVMCYPRAGPCESEATSGGIPGSDTSITSKITWRIIGLLKDIVNSLKSNKIGCRLQSCWIRRRITSLSDAQRSSNTRLTCWRKYSLIPGNNPQMKRLLKVHNSRS